MKALHRRVLAAGERVAGLRVEATPERSGMEQWADVLNRVLPVLEASDDPAAARRTPALIAEARVSGPPWAYLEYDCHAGVLRMHWPGFVHAFLDPDDDRQRGPDRTHRAFRNGMAVQRHRPRRLSSRAVRRSDRLHTAWPEMTVTHRIRGRPPTPEREPPD